MNRDSEGQMAFRGLFRPAALVTGAALLAAALAGCGGGGDQPITTPAPKSTTTTTTTTPTTTSTPSTSITRSTSTVPPAATAKGYNGAVDLVTTYFNRYNAANLSARLDLFDGLYTAACTDCAFLRDKVSTRLAKGVKPDGDIFTPIDIGIETYKPDLSPATATVLARVVGNPVRFLDSTGKTVDKYEREETTFRFSLQYSDRWVITSLRKVQ